MTTPWGDTNLCTQAEAKECSVCHFNKMCFFSLAVHCLTINKFALTRMQSLSFKLVNNVLLDQIDEAILGSIRNHTNYNKIKHFIGNSVK